MSSGGPDTTIAIVQFGSTLDRAANIHTVLAHLDDLVTRGARLDLVCLPEMFTVRALADIPPDAIHQYVEPADGPLERELAARARRLGAYLVAGSLLKRGSDGRVYNECAVFDRDGRVVTRYRKTHLFDAPGHSESDAVSAGDQLVIIETDFALVGVVVCYELRFPEVARALALAGATMLTVPNSWPVDGINLGSEQLRILLQATALLNQCYVVHANQYGNVGGLDLCGRSCVVDPKGEIVAQASDTEQTLLAHVDLSLVDSVRKIRSTFKHRRPELYQPQGVVVHPLPPLSSASEPTHRSRAARSGRP